MREPVLRLAKRSAGNVVRFSRDCQPLGACPPVPSARDLRPSSALGLQMIAADDMARTIVSDFRHTHFSFNAGTVARLRTRGDCERIKEIHPQAHLDLTLRSPWVHRGAFHRDAWLRSADGLEGSKFKMRFPA